MQISCFPSTLTSLQSLIYSEEYKSIGTRKAESVFTADLHSRIWS